MKEAVLGKRYELSLVFVGAKRAQTINRINRKKNYIPNVLALPLSKSTGEVFICLPQARREAREHNTSERNYVAYLFLHALLHLKGARHGATMERSERTLLRRFGITITN